MTDKNNNPKFIIEDDTSEIIKEDLVNQLASRDLDQVSFYVSLVDDYVSMWNVKNNLIRDIEERGVSVRYDNGGGQHGYKKNDSVGELTRLNRQMLSLLSELGLRAADIEEKEEEVTL